MSKQNNTGEANNKIHIERETKPETENEIQQQEVDQKDKELKAANEKIAELEKQIFELKDAFLRKAAEFEDYKRRNENDQLNILKYAAESFIKNILPIYDDLERSLSHLDDSSKEDSTVKGMLMVFEKFTKILDGQSVKRIDAKGKPFDVNLHEALMQMPADGVPPHTVLDVLENGYIYKDRVIKHAKVIVSQEMDSSHTSEENNQDNSTAQE